MGSIKVSVICITYNHEKYIRDALEGFVNQKTNFDYEVIIHDDASTDRTATIIREYQKKYPDIIKPILQNENQYSKGIPIFHTYIEPVIRGEYLAFCEGDDYWCDEMKLQRQIDFLDKHHDYVACVHNTEFYNLNTGKKFIRYSPLDKDLFLVDCVTEGAQSYQTSSLVVRRDVFFKRPLFTKSIKGVGDYPSAIYYSLSGKIRYFGSVMSVYRCGTAGSWTNRVMNDQSKMIEVTESTIEMLRMANEYSNKQYNDVFGKAIEFHRYRLNILTQNYKNAVKIKRLFRKEPFSVRIRLLLYCYFPITVKIRDLIINESRRNEN